MTLMKIRGKNALFVMSFCSYMLRIAADVVAPWRSECRKVFNIVRVYSAPKRREKSSDSAADEIKHRSMCIYI